MNRRHRYLVSMLAVLALPARAQGPIVLKLGTLAPQGSAWHEILKDMAVRWSDASCGRVKLRIYPGGVQGDEGDMIRKLGIEQLQAAALSNVGMHDLLPEPKALSIPFLHASAAEAACALERVRPTLEASLLRRGYVVLHWSRLGALHLFCDEPRRSPVEMETARFFAQEGDDRAAEAWRAAGFHPVQLSTSDLYAALQTGMIDCVPSLPIYVLTTRLFEKARYMSSMEWGFMYGATIVRRDAWETVPADVRERLLAIAHETGARADAEVRRMNDEALAVMRGRGLAVVPTEAPPWRAAMEKAYPLLRGDVVPAPFFDELMRARSQCQEGRRPGVAR